MSANSTSSPAIDDATFHPLPSMVADDTSFPTSSFIVLPFSAGNPTIEKTRGVMNLIPEDASSSPTNLPAGRKPLLCVLQVPSYMTYADFCMFCASFIQHVLDMRVVRNDEVENKYSVLLTFDDQNSTDGFYRHFNGKRFSSMEDDVCRTLFTVDVQYTSSIASSTELTNCPVCLERLDQDAGGILTTICNHSFHCSCISKWADSSCPVCRYCQQQTEKSICSVCETSENLSMCLTCGFVGCGRRREGHAIRHWKETQHCYSLELETHQAWDYVGDNYVHRLIQSKTDGKLVELNCHCTHTEDICGSCKCNADPGISETLLSSKVEATIDEYNILLTSQLENQRKYFESLMKEVKEETEYKISEAIRKLESNKLHKMKAKLDKLVDEKVFLSDVNDNLTRNKEMWQTKIQEAEERERTAIKLADEKIHALEQELTDLMVNIEG